MQECEIFVCGIFTFVCECQEFQYIMNYRNIQGHQNNLTSYTVQMFTICLMNMKSLTCTLARGSIFIFFGKIDMWGPDLVNIGKNNHVLEKQKRIKLSNILINL